MSTQARTTALKKLTSTDLLALATAAYIRIEEMEAYIADGGDRAVWEPHIAELSNARSRLIQIMGAT